MTTLPEIPPLGPEPPAKFETFFYWFRTQWQKTYEAIRDAFVAIEGTITDIEDTQADILATQVDLGETQLELSEAVDLLNDTIGIVEGNSDDLGTVGERLDAIESAATYAATGIDIVSGGVLKVNHVQVVGAQGAAVADAVAAAGVPTQAEFNAFVTQFNALLARARAHGLIAT